MRGVKKKSNNRNKRLAVFLLLIAVLALFLNSLRKVYNKKENAEKTLVAMEENIFNLQDKKENLEKSLNRLETEEGVKYEIRKKLNVAAAGESVAIIVEEESSSTQSSSNDSSWVRIKTFFSKLFE